MKSTTSKSWILLLILELICILVHEQASSSHAITAAERGEDDSTFCYDGCSGHGTCMNNACQCDEGWHGENCGTRFGLVPLTVGRINLTSLSDLNRAMFNNEAVLFGISTPACAKCGFAEEQYSKTNFSSVVFARIDALRLPEAFSALNIDPTLPLPILVFSWNKGKQRALFRGPHEAIVLTRFCEWKGQPPGFRLWTLRDEMPVAEPNTAVAVGFFTSFDGGKSFDKDSDEWDEFAVTAGMLRLRSDILVYVHPVVLKEKRPTWYPPKTVPLPALGVLSNGEWKYITLTEPPPDVPHAFTRPSLAEWISLISVADAAPLSLESFAMMEEVGLPMLILFASPPSLLTPLLPSFRLAAKEFRGRISFLYDAEAEYRDKLSVLGLFDQPGVSMAMNTKEQGLTLPYRGPSITGDTFRAFCMDFLAGRIKPEANKVISEDDRRLIADLEADEPEKDIPGVRERFKPSDISIADATFKWSDIALDESSDVIVFVHRTDKCVACRELAPFYKKACRRFSDLKQTSTKDHHIKCALLDISKNRPDGIAADLSLPSIIMLPAYNKGPPFRFFSAVAKVFTVMEWARINAGRPFDWGEELPQFTPEEKKLFKEQIKARELSRIEKENNQPDEL